MKSTTTTILTSAALLVLGLTGCASTEMQQQEVPSATSTPSVSATATPGDATEDATEAPAEEQGEEIVGELPTVESTVPTEVVEQYGEYADTLLESGNMLVSLTQGEMGDLQQARSGEEISFYEPLREHMTESAWTQIETALASEDQTARERAEGFIPQADRAGNLATIDDISYDVVEPGVIAFPLSEASIALTPEGGEGVTWTQTVQVIAYATPENLSFEREVTLWLVPAPDGGWEINDWHASEALDGVKVGE